MNYFYVFKFYDALNIKKTGQIKIFITMLLLKVTKCPEKTIITYSYTFESLFTWLLQICILRIIIHFLNFFIKVSNLLLFNKNHMTKLKSLKKIS